ncbi:MAG: ABC transporter substrate-binding protein [Desulfobacterales bacterium]|nr:ABC transporter substrate-binding protein [Desulfobacterales bacterium]
MKKRTIVIGLIVLILITAVFVILMITEEDYYIAVVAPMTGTYKEEGRDMLNGINMCLEEINRHGGVKGKRIKIRSYDDRNQVLASTNIASQISEDDKILMVLGHFDSDASIAAGNIYRKNGIPAITASASVPEVSIGNDFYFRIIPNNDFQGSFIANYLKNINKHHVRIIYNKGLYGSSLARSFEKTALDIGITIKKKWGYESDSETLNEEFGRIFTELRSSVDSKKKEFYSESLADSFGKKNWQIQDTQQTDDPDILFLAVNGDEASLIINGLKYSGVNYPIIGSDSFTTPSFMNGVKRFPQEQSNPGYFTDKIFALSPFLAELANEKGQKFKKIYQLKYSKEPSWVAAGYYDAAMVAIEAIKTLEINNSDPIRKVRRDIRDALAGMYQAENALTGVSGSIYFDKNGDVNRPMHFGIFLKQMFIPVNAQYQIVDKPIESDKTLEKVLNGDTIVIDGKVMNKYRVVYTGIDVNKISSLDIKNSTYELDFYLWFRFAGKFDDSNITFVNTVSPVRLGPPIAEEQNGQITVRTYHVTARFNGNFDFKKFPFDQQNLEIKFYHSYMTRQQLIYIVDVLGLQGISPQQNTDMKIASDWSIIDKVCYQDIHSNSSTLGIPGFFDSQNRPAYSRFNLSILLNRKSGGELQSHFLAISMK